MEVYSVNHQKLIIYSNKRADLFIKLPQNFYQLTHIQFNACSIKSLPINHTLKKSLLKAKGNKSHINIQQHMELIQLGTNKTSRLEQCCPCKISNNWHCMQSAKFLHLRKEWIFDTCMQDKWAWTVQMKQYCKICWQSQSGIGKGYIKLESYEMTLILLIMHSSSIF